MDNITIEVWDTTGNKKQLVDISQEIERNISGYLFTITLMNAAVGLLTGLAAYLFGMSDAILWGVAAFLLNYFQVIFQHTRVSHNHRSTWLESKINPGT